jgi:hypothetical protein
LWGLSLEISVAVDSQKQVRWGCMLMMLVIIHDSKTDPEFEEAILVLTIVPASWNFCQRLADSLASHFVIVSQSYSRHLKKMSFREELKSIEP